MGILNWLKQLFGFGKPIRKPRRHTGRKSKPVTYLSRKYQVKADRKFNMLLSKFKRTHRRKPTRAEMIKPIITGASHHVFPAKGRNAKPWTRRGRGHKNRQRVRKYLLEKHGIVKNYRMR
jgi:hypothetical protein